MGVLIDNRDFSSQGYVAPTVYLRADKYVSNFNYYSSLAGATNKYLYLHNQGGANTSPSGMKSFVNNQTAQTFGINCDFYVLQAGTWQLASYSWIKSNIASLPPCVFRFSTTDGSGPYYAILDTFYFGIAAISVGQLDPAKLAELDAFWREVQLMKYRYNSFVGFLNTLAKRELNVVEQKVFNEGMLMLNNLGNEMKAIRGITISYNSSGTVGNPVLLLIAIIAVLSAATAWTISTIISEKERTKRINDAYDLNKWVVDKKTQIAQQVAAGQISQQSADGINNTLDATAAVANKVAADASKTTGGTLSSIANILKWGVVGYLAYLLIPKKATSNGN